MSLIGPIPHSYPDPFRRSFRRQWCRRYCRSDTRTLLAAGFEISEAMRTANIAAGIVVKKVGTATLTIEELVQQNKKSCSLPKRIFSEKGTGFFTATHTDKVLMKCGISGQLG